MYERRETNVYRQCDLERTRHGHSGAMTSFAKVICRCVVFVSLYIGVFALLVWSPALRVASESGKHELDPWQTILVFVSACLCSVSMGALIMTFAWYVSSCVNNLLIDLYNLEHIYPPRKDTFPWLPRSYDMYMVCIWYIYGMYMVCIWYVYGVCM